MSNNVFVEVIVDNKSTSTDKFFTYIIPGIFKDKIKIGMRVMVPFGSGNKLLESIVINIKHDISIDIRKLKEVDSLLEDEPILSEKMVELGLWMKAKYLAQYLEVFRTMIPTGVSNKVKKYVYLKTDFNLKNITNIDSKNQQRIVEFLLKNGETELNIIRDKLGMKNIYSSIKSLQKKGIIQIQEKIDTGLNKKYERYIHLCHAEEDIDTIIKKINPRAYKQQEIINYIYNNGTVRQKDLIKDIGCTSSSIKNLEKKGLLKIVEREIKRNPINKKIDKNKKLKFNEEQEICFDAIYGDIVNGKNNKFLIHGVTGSGKTEIYLQLIERMLELKRQSIVLVPEISLTPQTVDRFMGRFGNRVAVLHSKLSLGERYDEWRKIKEGSVDIVVGARSAIFAPFKDLGLIIIDEEHETSYKSSMNPKYNALEVAEKRCELEDSFLILGSATPSLETFYKAKKGELKLLTLENRANNKKMPPVDIIDMKQELTKGNKSILSNRLYLAIKNNLEDNKQTILFLNRRGFSTFVSCRECGYVAKCKDCDISLTYHKNKNLLKCHYCGLTKKVPTLCPECGSKYIKYFGIGTQKIEEIIKETFPNARVVRMDVDTTVKKGSHERILEKVKNGETDILIGTQMIAKGLDFPNVTLVGIIAADISLNLPDFRSSERTFQLVTQVSGRAGRGELDGNVILQTYEPEHFSIQFAKNHDYVNFYKNEIKLRKGFEYPPFLNIINIVITSKIQNKLYEVSNDIKNNIENIIKLNLKNSLSNRVFGPNPAPISKIKSNYRWQILIKCRDDELDIIKDIVYRVCIKDREKKQMDNIKISIDINPNSIM